MPTPAYPPPIPADNKADSTPLTGDHPAHHNALAEAIDSIITNKLGTAAAPLSSTFAPLTGPFAPSTTGATAATRYVGGTAAGAPTTGAHLVGDFVPDGNADIWVCTVAGTPGTWKKVGSASYGPIPTTTDARLFVSKGSLANDANDGLTPGSPKATWTAALTALAGPGEVVGGYGTFTEAAALAPAANVTGLTLRGVGRGATVIKGAGGAAHVFNATGTSGGINEITLMDLTIDGNGTTGDGVRLDTAHHCELNRVEVKAAFNGVSIRRGYYNTLRNVWAHDNTNDGLMVGDTGNATTVKDGHYRLNTNANIEFNGENAAGKLHGCTVEGATIEGTAGNVGDGIKVLGANEIRISDCYIEINENTTQISTTSTTTAGSAVVTDTANPFAANQVGHTITLTGAGAAGAALTATVLSYQNAGQITLNINATTAVAGTSTATVTSPGRGWCITIDQDSGGNGSDYCVVEACNFTGTKDSIYAGKASRFEALNNSINQSFHLSSTATNPRLGQQARIDRGISDACTTTAFLFDATVSNGYYWKNGTNKFSVLVGGSVTQIANAAANAMQFMVNGQTPLQILSNNQVQISIQLNLADGCDIDVGTTSGTSLGRNGSSKTGMHGIKIAQAARSGQLTDNSGGASGGATIAVINGAVDPTAALKTDTANAIATLAAKVNALEAIIHNKGITA